MAAAGPSGALSTSPPRACSAPLLVKPPTALGRLTTQWHLRAWRRARGARGAPGRAGAGRRTWSPRPLKQQSNLSKMQSFSYRSTSCARRANSYGSPSQPYRVGTNPNLAQRSWAVLRESRTAPALTHEAQTAGRIQIFSACRQPQALATADTLIRVSATQAGRPAPPHGAAHARARTRCRSGSWTDMTATGSDSMRTSLRARPAALAADSRLPPPST